MNSGHIEGSQKLDMRHGQGQLVNVQTMHPVIQAILVSASIIALAFAIGAWVTAEYVRNDNQYTRNKVERLVIEVDNNNAILMRSGLKEPEDMARGPAGNPNYPKRK